METEHRYLKTIEEVAFQGNRLEMSNITVGMSSVGISYLWQLLCLNEREIKKIERIGGSTFDVIRKGLEGLKCSVGELRDVRAELGFDDKAITAHGLFGTPFPFLINGKRVDDPVTRNAYFKQVIYNHLCRTGKIKISAAGIREDDAAYFERFIDPRLLSALTPAFRAAVFLDPKLQEDICKALSASIKRNLGLGS